MMASNEDFSKGNTNLGKNYITIVRICVRVCIFTMDSANKLRHFVLLEFGSFPHNTYKMDKVS
jgi:hypothetical protein